MTFDRVRHKLAPLERSQESEPPRDFVRARGVTILGVEGDTIKAEANYQVLETLPDEFTKILNAGRYFDTFAREAGALKLKERLCIYDSEMVPATPVYPI